ASLLTLSLQVGGHDAFHLFGLAGGADVGAALVCARAATVAPSLTLRVALSIVVDVSFRRGGVAVLRLRACRCAAEARSEQQGEHTRQNTAHLHLHGDL